MPGDNRSRLQATTFLETVVATIANYDVIKDVNAEEVEVSCADQFENGEWVGACEIEGEPQRYRLRE